MYSFSTPVKNIQSHSRFSLLTYNCIIICLIIAARTVFEDCRYPENSYSNMLTSKVAHTYRLDTWQRNVTKGQKDITTLRRQSFHRIYAAVKRDLASGPRDRLKDERKSATEDETRDGEERRGRGGEG